MKTPERTESYGEGEKPVAWTKTPRKARKPWTCVECGESIAPGDRYVEMSGVWPDGGPQRFRQCLTCDRWATSALHGLGLCHYPIGLLREAIEELTRQDSGGELPVYYVDRSRV